ncbi:DNA double-strand break repair rad50 ATPase, putative isoform 1 [Hibiscus syriacus]|uniref:DNA double-strand break repair rad50 ATPase, putative isoform 1 n=1 Tax=Hibiscus syriacus TaxID=106335 RepID=A0A6A3BRR8_HIBSY|nr:DNA double-strand break repair rad50 ATPase, putative isoform 1 [Hibiscus syriacus]
MLCVPHLKEAPFGACLGVVLVIIELRRKGVWVGDRGKRLPWLRGSLSVLLGSVVAKASLNGLIVVLGLLSSLCQQLLLFIFWLSSFQDVATLQTLHDPRHISSTSELAKPPATALFEPIEISPAVIPRYPYPDASLPPMYPSFPSTYEPNLTGRCPVNFSAMSNIMGKTASDCSLPLAALVGNVICCPQLGSLLHIFQGYYSADSDKLVLRNAVANDCFSDIISILASRGANSTIPTVCSVKSSNLTGGSCPVKDVSTFEKTVNTSNLLEACSTVDPLKECCRPVCQPAIMEAALQISGTQMMLNDNKNVVGETNHIDAINECKGVVYSYLSRKLSPDVANTAFRILSACKVNKVSDVNSIGCASCLGKVQVEMILYYMVLSFGERMKMEAMICPLEFNQPSEVIKACRNVAAPSPSCCSSLNTYIVGIQKQMLITNKQAIVCAIMFGSILRKGGVLTNVYELCDVDLKDFSIQGCLLRSLPADVVFDNSTGYSFTCDLTDNIGAPWPSSSSMSSLSLCAPEMSLPALPTSDMLKNPGV